MKFKFISNEVEENIAPFPAKLFVGMTWNHDIVPDKVQLHKDLIGSVNVKKKELVKLIGSDNVVLGAFEFVDESPHSIKEMLDAIQESGVSVMFETAYTMDEFMYRLGVKLAGATGLDDKLTDYILTEEDKGIYTFLANASLGAIIPETYYVMTQVTTEPKLIEVRPCEE